MKFSCIIVDDDPLSVEQMTEYIKGIPKLTLIGSFTSPGMAIKAIQALDTPLDFLFTDVEMSEVSGIALARHIMHKVRNLVLVSGHLKYAIDGYDLDAKHFLAKPFNFKQFESIVNKLSPKEYAYINIKEGKTIEKVDLQTVIAFEGASNYVKVHTTRKLFMTYSKLSEIESELSQSSNFIRINRSFIISKSHIEKINGKKIFLKNSIQLSPGSTFKDEFNDLILFINSSGIPVSTE